jgi:hypothetical protein
MTRKNGFITLLIEWIQIQNTTTINTHSASKPSHGQNGSMCVTVVVVSFVLCVFSRRSAFVVLSQSLFVVIDSFVDEDLKGAQESIVA